MNYTKASLTHLRTMYNILKREGVDAKNPPEALKPRGPLEFKSYSPATIRLLRWAVPIIAQHGEAVLQFKPNPIPRDHSARSREQQAYRQRLKETK